VEKTRRTSWGLSRATLLLPVTIEAFLSCLLVVEDLGSRFCLAETNPKYSV
jgi:hypothetical protein